jgi:hypothetical protein
MEEMMARREFAGDILVFEVGEADEAALGGLEGDDLRLVLGENFGFGREFGRG